MIERTFRLSDVVDEQFLRLPLSLLANPKYRRMSLEAKFVYSLLLNRLSLSQKNRWINDDNEVYLIYTREEVADTLNISYKKSIAAFKELIENGLLFEQRQGRGYPNLLYVLKAELDDKDAAEFSEEFYGTDDETVDENEGENPHPDKTCQTGTSRHAETAHQELPNRHIKNCGFDISRTAKTAHQDMPKTHSIKKDNKYTENSQTENLSAALTDTADGAVLDEIFRRCELSLFKSEIALMFRQAVERMYFSESLKIGDARLPKAKVRSYLTLLDYEVLASVLESMRENESRITNPTAYLMSSIINGICEKESDLILSLPPQYQSTDDFYRKDKGDDYFVTQQSAKDDT